jgi:hypothetical protein
MASFCMILFVSVGNGAKIVKKVKIRMGKNQTSIVFPFKTSVSLTLTCCVVFP